MQHFTLHNQSDRTRPTRAPTKGMNERTSPLSSFPEHSNMPTAQVKRKKRSGEISLSCRRGHAPKKDHFFRAAVVRRQVAGPKDSRTEFIGREKAWYTYSAHRGS